MLLLFVEIPVCREHLRVHRPPEAATAGAECKLAAACFLLIIQLLGVAASAAENAEHPELLGVCVFVTLIPLISLRMQWL